MYNQELDVAGEYQRRVSSNIYIYIYIYIVVCACVCVCVCVYRCVCVCVCVCVYVCMYVCMYVCIYMYIIGEQQNTAAEWVLYGTRRFRGRRRVHWQPEGHGLQKRRVWPRLLPRLQVRWGGGDVHELSATHELEHELVWFQCADSCGGGSEGVCGGGGGRGIDLGGLLRRWRH